MRNSVFHCLGMCFVECKNEYLGKDSRILSLTFSRGVLKYLLPAWDEHSGIHSNTPSRREFTRK